MRIRQFVSPVVRSMAVLAVVLCAVATRPASAAPTDPVAILTQLPGLETAYARKYLSADLATPNAAATPAATPRHLVVTATALAFATAPDRQRATRLLRDDATLRQLLGEPFGTIMETDAPTVGPGAAIFLVRTDIGDGNAHALLIAHRDNLAFLVRADGPEAALKPALRRFGQFMVHAEPGAGTPAAHPPAPPTGGLWNVFPARDDENVLQLLIPMFDYDLLGPTGEAPIGSATPAG